MVDGISARGCTPLVVAENDTVLGVIRLSEVVKPGMNARFAELRAMGIRTVMVTGDNPLTAKAQLRRKLEADPARPRHRITEPGMGYRFER